MSRKVWIRIPDDQVARFESELKRKGDESPSDFFGELLTAYLNLKDTISNIGGLLDPIAGCATCNRIYRKGEEVQIKACQTADHFVVAMGV